ncbi:hypothetical protein ATERTT37_007628 [Aspergillus terreus]
MSEMYSGLHVGQRFSSLEEFKALVRNISVRQHWELRVTRSNKKSVVIGCRSSSNCFFRVVCRANKNSTYISSLQDSHSCRRNESSASKAPVRSEVSHVRFLLAEIPKLFDITSSIKAQDVVDAVKRYHGYQISMRQAQRALIRLQQQQPQGQAERAETLESSGDDHQDSQLPASEEQAEGSAYSGLSGQRWMPENLQSHLVDNSVQQCNLIRIYITRIHYHLLLMSNPNPIFKRKAYQRSAARLTISLSLIRLFILYRRLLRRRANGLNDRFRMPDILLHRHR